MRRQIGWIAEKQLFIRNSVCGPHRRRRNGDQACDRNPCCNALSNGATHRMPGQNRTVSSDYSTRKQFSEKRFPTLFRARGRERPRRTPVSRQVWNVNSQALLHKTSCEVRHNFFVCGDSVEKQHRSLSACPWLFNDGGFQPAAISVEDIRPFPIRCWECQPES